MFYGSNVWDPALIIAQIVSVQCLFYISLGLIQAITIGPTLGYITIAYIFDWGTLHFSSKLGMLNWISHVVNAVAGAAALAWVVERAKKCLDFGSTCYLWHTIFVCWYSGWPQSFAWWLATAGGMLVMVLLGEWFCVRREMQDIPLSIPQRLGSGFLSRGRKESGQVAVPMMALPTDDPDQPVRPRLRAGLSTLQRSSAAAAAAGTAAVGSSTAFTSSQAPAVTTAASPAQLPPAAARPGAAVQMVQLSPLPGTGAGGGGSSGAGGSPQHGSSSSSSSGLSRKKLQLRPASQSNLGTGKQQGLGGASAVPVANGAASGLDNGEVEPA